MPLALSSATRAPGNRGLGNRKAVTPYHSGHFSALGRGNRGGLRRPLLLLLLVRRQLLLAGQHEVAGAGLPPAGLVALAVVVVAGVVDQQLLLPLSDGVRLRD